MRVSDLICLTHRALAVTCAASVSLAAMPKLGFATDLAAAAGLAAGAEVHVARERQGSRARPSSSRKGSADTRRRDRPGASSRYPRGSAAGSLSRPAPGFNRGNRVPSGGWVNKTPPGSLRPARPPLRPRPDRPNWNRPGWDRPNWNRPGWNRPRWVFNRPVQINNIYGRPGWWGPGWSGSRPWRYGWYNGGYNRWNWWNSSSLIWGITSLASAAIIGAAINNALQQDRPTIVVKDSPYELVFGSVNAVNGDEVEFTFLMGDGSYEARANCRAGTLNGRQPVNPEEAQLMNAACQVAFSNF